MIGAAAKCRGVGKELPTLCCKFSNPLGHPSGADWSLLKIASLVQYCRR